MNEMPPRSWQRRLLRAFLLYLVTPYLAVTLIMVLAQRKLIFQPTKTGRLYAEEHAHGNDVADVDLVAEHELALQGWLIRADDDEPDAPNFLVIYFPGNAGCRRDRLADCRDFTRLGCDVLLVDYRGYGDNQGSPSEARFAEDARLIWQYATRKRNVPSRRIVLFGESLGGAVATRLAAELSREDTPPAALILNSTFASLGDTVAWHYPAFPFRYLLWDRFPSVDRMPDVTCPVLLFHGTADSTIPWEQGRRLFDASRTDLASGIANRMVTIPDGEHNFISMTDMRAAVSDLLAEIRDTLRDREP